MEEFIHNRLTVIGSKGQVKRFVASRWNRSLRGKYGEWWENSPGRFVCQFETETPALEALKCYLGAGHGLPSCSTRKMRRGGSKVWLRRRQAKL